MPLDSCVAHVALFMVVFPICWVLGGAGVHIDTHGVYESKVPRIERLWDITSDTDTLVLPSAHGHANKTKKGIIPFRIARAVSAICAVLHT